MPARSSTPSPEAVRRLGYAYRRLKKSFSCWKGLRRRSAEGFSLSADAPEFVPPLQLPEYLPAVPMLDGVPSFSSPTPDNTDSDDEIICLNRPLYVTEPTPTAVHLNPPKEPTRPPSAFFLFIKDKQPELPIGVSMREGAKTLAEMWKNADTDTKSRYAGLAQELKKTYDQELSEYMTNPLAENSNGSGGVVVASSDSDSSGSEAGTYTAVDYVLDGLPDPEGEWDLFENGLLESLALQFNEILAGGTMNLDAVVRMMEPKVQDVSVRLCTHYSPDTGGPITPAEGKQIAALIQEFVLKRAERLVREATTATSTTASSGTNAARHC